MIGGRWAVRLALAAALAAALLGLWGWAQATRAKALEARLEAAEAAIAGYEEAARIRRKTDRVLEQLRGEAAQLDTYLDTMEGGDAPLSDFLSDAARRLWP
ncbi:hypothetical protein [Celeribacter indicus]|uniref:Uncharacterized protein n=1 Tax=Celeribacter indicus TaxID=1208324 RepID=A0A0B5E0L3_9RHOB|nr:hypothetical protein [Celeribacter indicus]AJE46007.1 hypothetical protein P73_1292 [Celeribacter indicus]SDX32712.1 hypothetical protein SAMN05443573_1227 [Celeribacter indicus]